jgi:hypothetical protein
MKTTVEIPDALMTELKVLAAVERKRLREVMEEVLRAGLRARRGGTGEGQDRRIQAEAWLREWQELGDEIEDSAVDPGSVVSIVIGDRR